MKRTVLIFILIFISITTHVMAKNRYDQAYESFKSLSNSKLIDIGDRYYDKEVMDSALICYTIVSRRYDTHMPHEDKKLSAYAYMRLGNIHYIMYNYVQAQDMYLQSLEVCKECDLDSIIPRVYNNLGNIYSSFNDFKKAENYYKQAYKNSQTIADSSLSKIILNNLIGVYCNLNDNKTLKYYLNLSDQTLKDSNNDYFNISAKGVWNLNEGNYPTSIRYQKRALHLADSLHLDPLYECSALTNISDAFMNMQRYDSAECYLLKCADIAVENRLLDMQINIYRELSYVYNIQNKADKFLHYTKLYQNINDSIKGMRGYRSIKNVEFLFEMNQIDKQITAMRMEQLLKDARYANQQLILLIVCITLAMITLFLILTYRQKHQLQRSYKDIFKRNQEIVESDKQAKQRDLKYKEEIKKKDESIAQLQQQIAELSIDNVDDPELPANVEPKPNGDPPQKYQGSSLSKEQKEQLLQAINEVMDNTLEFCNVDFTLEKMAYLTNSKTKYVSQIINEVYGKNFNRFVNEYRIKEARSRLMNTETYGNYTVKAIAQSVGFKSNTNFNQLFKELTGITPSMYQDMAQG
ncbi:MULTISPECIES: AraC family transcriptional regulator [unclassified Bacteroides]|uniref:AraC family transcriptional regulator n=1 Tax=unclassified Bacteroides TaxID=2646097 RepID=UPI0011C0D7BB|nr:MULTISPECIES: AraC family transcriptional regulator [unclassified Bacteroides]